MLNGQSTASRGSGVCAFLQIFLYLEELHHTDLLSCIMHISMHLKIMRHGNRKERSKEKNREQSFLELYKCT